MAKISTIARDPENVLTLGDAPVYAPVAKVVDGPDPIGGVVDLTAVSDGILALSGAINPRSLGAVGDGETDDTGPINDAVDLAHGSAAAVGLTGGVYAVTTPVMARGVVRGSGRNLSLLSRTGGTSSGVTVNDDGVSVTGIAVDMRASDAGRSGHGLRVTGDHFTLRDAEVRDFGAMSAGGAGTGVLVMPGGASRPQRPQMTDVSLFGNPDALEAIGWLFSDSDYGVAAHVHAEGIVGSDGVGYAHELKNDARWNNLHALTAVGSTWALAYGQQTEGIDGAKYNVALGVLADKCDGGYLVGEGRHNLLIGLVYNDTESPRLVNRAAVAYTGAATRNTTIGAVFTGSSGATGVRVREGSIDNYTSVAMMGNLNATIVDLASGVSRNVTEILHPGSSDTIRQRIVDNSGRGLASTSANPIYCSATGERIGSLSGSFHDALGNSGASFDPAHRFRTEHETTVVHAMGTDGTAGNVAGISHSVPDNAARGGISHTLGATEADDYWSLTGWGGEVEYRFTASEFHAEDNIVSLGSPSNRWAGIHAVLPVYADDAAAAAGGLTQGALYITATGEVRGKL